MSRDKVSDLWASEWVYEKESEMETKFRLFKNVATVQKCRILLLTKEKAQKLKYKSST